MNRLDARTIASAPAALAVLLGSLAAGCASTGPVAQPVYFPPPPATAHVVHLVSFNRMDDLVPLKHSWMEAFRGGAVVPFVGTPAGIAYHDGHLYICDTDKNFVHDWDLTNGKARRLGVGEQMQLGKPVAVAADDEGTVYVADTQRGQVVAFRPGGFHTFAPPDRPDYKPAAVAVRDRKLYAADIASHKIDVFSTADGSHTGSFGGTGSGEGQLYFPLGVTTTGNGLILVSDAMNGRVQVFNSGRDPVRTIGGLGDRYGDMGRPRHVAVGPDEVVFVADAAFARVHLFNLEGQLLMLLGSEEVGPGATPMPVGVAVAPSLPDTLAALVPADFDAHYYLFTTNSIGRQRISLYAVGLSR